MLGCSGLPLSSRVLGAHLFACYSAGAAPALHRPANLRCPVALGL